jgi:hypothetical protein
MRRWEWDSWNSSLQIFESVGRSPSPWPSPPGEGTGTVAVRKDFAAFVPSRETFWKPPRFKIQAPEKIQCSIIKHPRRVVNP